MAFSTIIRKKCKCGVIDHYPTLGYKGWNIRCFPQELKDAEPEKYRKGNVNRRNRANLSKMSRKLHEVAKASGNELSASHEAVMNPQGHWYEDRRTEMEGYCHNCQKKTNPKDDKYYRWNVCHLVPKSIIPSVAMNEFNWIELCQGCHNEYDNTFDRAAAMPVFGEIKQKFQLFKHLIPDFEMRKVNPHLLNIPLQPPGVNQKNKYQKSQH